MKINGEEIIGFNVDGVLGGTLNIEPLKTLKECYDFIQEDKRIYRKYTGSCDEKYTIEIETKGNIYIGYTLKKYKNKYWLKWEV